MCIRYGSHVPLRISILRKVEISVFIGVGAGVVGLNVEKELLLGIKFIIRQLFDEEDDRREETGGRTMTHDYDKTDDG